jgi:hypothetical protein
MIASCLILFFTAIFIGLLIFINKHFSTIAVIKKEVPFNPRMTEAEQYFIKTRLEKSTNFSEVSMFMYGRLLHYTREMKMAFRHNKTEICCYVYVTKTPSGFQLEMKYEKVPIRTYIGLNEFISDMRDLNFMDADLAIKKLKMEKKEAIMREDFI